MLLEIALKVAKSERDRMEIAINSSMSVKPILPTFDPVIFNLRFVISYIQFSLVNSCLQIKCRLSRRFVRASGGSGDGNDNLWLKVIGAVRRRTEHSEREAIYNNLWRSHSICRAAVDRARQHAAGQSIGHLA